MRIRFLAPVFFFSLCSSLLAQSSKHPFTFEDMMKLKRVDEPVPSPDGKWVVFSATDVDLEANTKISHLWIVPANGGPAEAGKRLSETPNHEERPRFSPDGKKLIWTSKATDPTQIWMCDFNSDSGTLVGQPHQVTSISTGADGGIWSPDGRNIVFVSAVYPDCKDDACNKQRDEELKKSKVKAKIFTKLFYRHWNAFTEFKRSHLFVVSADAVATGLWPVGSEAPQQEERPTGPRLQPTDLTPGADTPPLYSPDGKYLAWRSQARAGFEADKWRLFVQDRQSGKTRDWTEGFDRSIGSFAWDPKGGFIYFSYETLGQAVFGEATPDILSERKNGVVIPAFGKAETKVDIQSGHLDDFAVAPENLYFTRNFASAPAEIWRTTIRTPLESQDDISKLHQVTHMNDALLSQIDMQPLESFTFKGANDEEVQGFMVKPPGFDPNKKYPLKFLIHGGPQGAWGNSGTYRWNAELFAATGNYVVVMINFHGSTGYGQKFCDSISGDWGGKPYVDLIKGLDYVEKTYPFIDKNREAALGASYGGYMANWIMGHTDRFKCIVSHDGTFNNESVYGTTEELWFPEWEFKGPPWKQRELYRKFSPHLFADKFKTPTLVVHGQSDYRLDVSEGFQLFTTLQRLKIPSKMLYFPDEGHWVLKPQNSRLWYKTVNDWVDQWCGGRGAVGAQN